MDKKWSYQAASMQGYTYDQCLENDLAHKKEKCDHDWESLVLSFKWCQICGTIREGNRPFIYRIPKRNFK